jgi:uncharacterized membrane protein
MWNRSVHFVLRRQELMEACMSDFRDQVTDRPARESRRPEHRVSRAEPAVAPPRRNPRSTASIAGHPIHPMLIPFPIAFFVATFVCDLVFWGTRNPSWFDATLWLLGAGLIMAALAAVAGLTDVLGDTRIRSLSTAWWHAGGNVLVVLIELANWYLRYSQGSAAVLPTGIILSAIVVAILLFTGWKGWELVYRGRVGVADDSGAL